MYPAESAGGAAAHETKTGSTLAHSAGRYRRQFGPKAQSFGSSFKKDQRIRNRMKAAAS
jgi:hypothetical protein